MGAGCSSDDGAFVSELRAPRSASLRPRAPRNEGPVRVQQQHVKQQGEHSNSKNYNNNKTKQQLYMDATPLLDTQDPKLVPLETLDGRNHIDFPASEEPPWRWRVESVYP